MSAALLASPSSVYSPPTSPLEDSFSLSPNLPEISSPFDINKQYKSHQYNDITPTKLSASSTINLNSLLTPIVGNEQPSWVTDELDQEWVEEEEEEGEGNDPSTTTTTSYSGSPTITKPPSNLSSSSSTRTARPRVPSSLRNSFTSNRSTTTPKTTTLTKSSSSPTGSNSSTVGTFVVRGDYKTSMKERSNQHVKEGENQLQAAVRALRGPSSGLGAAPSVLVDHEQVGEGEMETPQKSGKKVAGNGDRLGGLLNLFRPLSPTAPPLPPSTVSAPSIDLFTFSPPIIPVRTSWKSLPHFSPADNNTTPKPHSNQYMSTPPPLIGEEYEEGDDLNTPVRNGNGVAPPIKIKDRYLRSSNITEPLHVVVTSSSSGLLINLDEEEVEADDLLTPFPTTPAPQPSTPTFSQHSNQGTPRSTAGLRLFEFKYDTATQAHLAALVDEIDGLGSLRGKNHEDQAWETSFVDVPPPSTEELVEDDEAEYEGEAGRSSKRIRLSPLTIVSEPRNRLGDRSNITSSTRRSRHQRSSPSNRSSATPITNSMRNRSLELASRDRSTEGPSLVDRMRLQSGLRSSTTTTNTVTPKQSQQQHYVDISPPLPSSMQLLPSSVTIRSRATSPRKLLRQVSASDEVDGELLLSPPPALSTSTSTARNGLRSTLRKDSRPISSIGIGSVARRVTSINAISSTSSVPASPIMHRQFITTPVLAGSASPLQASSNQLYPFNQPLPISAFSSSTTNVISPPLPPVAIDFSSSSSYNTPTLPLIAPGSVLRRAGGALITTIGPQDAEALLASTSTTKNRMVFDKEAGKWNKLARNSRNQPQPEEEVDLFDDGSSQSSEDPFKEFDNSRVMSDHDEERKEASTGITPIITGGRNGNTDMGLSGLGISAGTPLTTVTMSPLDANHFDTSPIERTLSPEEDGGQEDGWQDQSNYIGGEERSRIEQHSEEELAEEESPYHLYTRAMESEPESPTISPLPPINSTPILNNNSTPRPSHRSTSLSPSSSTLTTLPRSALKPTVRSSSDPDFELESSQTPRSKIDHGSRLVPRSVSFSDGKLSGRIVEGTASGGGGVGSRLRYEVDGENDSEEEDIEGVGEAEMMGEQSGRRQEFASVLRKFDRDMLHSHSDLTSRPARSQLQLEHSIAKTPTYRRTTALDATFLTEASFSLSNENLLRLITDVDLCGNWEEQRSISLAGKGVDSLVRLKDHLPNLDEADFTNNEITFLTGIPSTIRTLLISSNKISELTSFDHLRNLERIDISNNVIDSVFRLSSLRHLRELKADNNGIRDISGLADLDSLLRLSLKGNQIESIDFGNTKWTRLETLSLSRNKLSSLEGLGTLKNLAIINLDHNDLTSIESNNLLPKLRVLRVSSNPIQSIDIGFAPKLRTLFIDGARLGELEGTSQLRKLENLSVRDQNGAAIILNMKDVRDVKRLYLSGNAVPTSFPTEQFFNLIYLELAMCQLTSLPENLASLIPNVRVLNLNFNFIEDLSPLTGLTRLNKLTVLGARLKKCRPIAKVLESMPELELLDLRLNPFTLPFYPPLILQDHSEIVAPHSEYQILHPDDDSVSNPTSHHWPAVDQKFRKALPDLWYFKRMTYRAVMLESAKNLVTLDGIDCKQERNRLPKMLSGLSKR